MTNNHPLDPAYLISYGHANAPVRITEYFSFACPQSAQLFQQQFQALKTTYIDTHLISFTFHPIPIDLSTMVAMECLRQLDKIQKQVFLEVMLEACEWDNPELLTELMVRAMGVFGKPVTCLDDHQHLTTTQAYREGVTFLDTITTLPSSPSCEIQGIYYPNDMPTLEFIKSKINPKAFYALHQRVSKH